MHFFNQEIFLGKSLFNYIDSIRYNKMGPLLVKCLKIKNILFSGTVTVIKSETVTR